MTNNVRTGGPNRTSVRQSVGLVAEAPLSIVARITLIRYPYFFFPAKQRKLSRDCISQHDFRQIRSSSSSHNGRRMTPWPSPPPPPHTSLVPPPCRRQPVASASDFCSPDSAAIRWAALRFARSEICTFYYIFYELDEICGISQGSIK